ncbi:hypothetical protein ACCO45_001670 [Purpureocillium lilacinum]|uniref:Uncharacterized protein n=1 Tax=Purpureocillium lilacinum TaxID=33203 RepID=A0ACC4E7N5_PURLI
MVGDSAGRLGEAGLGKDCDHGGAASGCIEARPLAVCLKDSTGDDLVFRVHQMRWRLGLGRPGLPAWLLTDLVNCGRQPKKGRQRGGISPTVHAMAGAVAADLDGGSQYPWATVAHGYHIDDNLAITARIDDSDPGGLRLWQGPGRAGPDPGPK